MANEVKPTNTVETKPAAPVESAAKEVKVETAQAATTAVKPTAPVKEAAPKVEPKKKVAVAAPAPTTPAPAPAPAQQAPKAIQFKVGELVTIKETVTKTVVDTVIPVFAYKNIYKITKILEDRIIIASGTLMFPLKADDLNPVLLNE